jgi:regulatory protein YycI of two-component signal transduction system YycFG
MKKSKVIVVFILTSILLVGIIVYYQFNKPHRNFSEESASFNLSAMELVESYQKDPALSDSLYVDQFVAVTGEIMELTDQSILLSPGVYLNLDSTQNFELLKVGQEVSLVGRVLSFDPLFEEVKMDNARIKD